MPRPVERPHLRAEPQAVGVLEAEADDQEIEIAVGKPQQRTGRIGLALHMMLPLQRAQDALGRAVAVLDQEDAAAAPKLIELDPHGRDKTHLFLGRGAHQHLVREHLEPRQVLHPRDQRDVVDRLRQKVVGSGLEPLHPVGGLIERGDHDHRDMLRARLDFQPPADLKTVHPGHHHVEQNHVGPLARADMQRLGTAPRRAHLEIFGCEPRFEKFHIGVDVVDDKNACGHGLATVLRR
jgi:hypothetical protein